MIIFYEILINLNLYIVYNKIYYLILLFIFIIPFITLITLITLRIGIGITTG